MDAQYPAIAWELWNGCRRDSDLDEGEQVRQLAQAGAAEGRLLQRVQLDHQLRPGFQRGRQVEPPQQGSRQSRHRCFLAPARGEDDS